MNRTARQAKATETLSILENGVYISNDKTIDIQQELQLAIDRSELYMDRDFPLIMEAVAKIVSQSKFQTVISVENITVLEGATKLLQSAGEIGCLNFASANNPGGGFLNGSLAQEESLAVSSGLYATQMKHFEFYNYNRNRKSFLYSDIMIYSPQVMVFRNDDGDLLASPYKLSIITSPAVNVSAIKANKPEELQLVEETMLCRMDKVLGLFVYHGITKLLLGAWGCGVFQNDPKQIATWFAHYLKKDGKYYGCFEEVVFAVFDKSKTQENIEAFKALF